MSKFLKLTKCPNRSGSMRIFSVLAVGFFASNVLLASARAEGEEISKSRSASRALRPALICSTGFGSWSEPFGSCSRKCSTSKIKILGMALIPGFAPWKLWEIPIREQAALRRLQSPRQSIPAKQRAVAMASFAKIQSASSKTLRLSSY